MQVDRASYCAGARQVPLIPLHQPSSPVINPIVHLRLGRVDMDLKALQQHILISDKSAAEKARSFTKIKNGYQLTLPQWQTLIYAVPEEILEVLPELLESTGTAASYSALQKTAGKL